MLKILSWSKNNNEIFILLFIFSMFISIAVSNIFLVLAILSFLYYAYKNGLKVSDDSKKYFIPFLIFFATMLLSALFSGDIMRGLKRAADCWLWRYIPFVIIALTFNDTQKVTNIFAAFLAGFTINNLYIVYYGVVEGSRASGFYGNAMMHAGFLCIVLPILLVLIFEDDIVKIPKYLLMIVCGIGYLALLYNETRGAWLAVALVFFMILANYIRKNKKICIATIAVCVALTAMVSLNGRLLERTKSIADTGNLGNMERILIWNSAWSMFKDHPVLGVGQGQYKKQYQNKYISTNAKNPALTHAHNNLLQMLAENGIIGFAGYVILFGTIIYNSVREYINNRNPGHFMIVCSTLGLILQGMTEYNFGQSGVMKCFWSMLGCLVVFGEGWKKNL